MGEGGGEIVSVQEDSGRVGWDGAGGAHPRGVPAFVQAGRGMSRERQSSGGPADERESSSSLLSGPTPPSTSAQLAPPTRTLHSPSPAEHNACRIACAEGVSRPRQRPGEMPPPAPLTLALVVSSFLSLARSHTRTFLNEVAALEVAPSASMAGTAGVEGVDMVCVFEEGDGGRTEETGRRGRRQRRGVRDEGKTRAQLLRVKSPVAPPHPQRSLLSCLREPW